MSKLRKIQNAEDIFTVTIHSSTDLTNYAESYQTEDPASDDLTKILVYAHKNNWYINNWGTLIELMKQLENHLTEDELLKLSNVETLIICQTKLTPMHITELKTSPLLNLVKSMNLMSQKKISTTFFLI